MRVLGCCSLQKIQCLAICTLADYDYLIVGSILLTQEHREIPLQFSQIIVCGNEYADRRLILCRFCFLKAQRAQKWIYQRSENRQ